MLDHFTYCVEPMGIEHAQTVTPLVAEATRAALDAGVRDIRNQDVLMRGVNATPGDVASGPDTRSGSPRAVEPAGSPGWSPDSRPSGIGRRSHCASRR